MIRRLILVTLALGLLVPTSGRASLSGCEALDAIAGADGVTPLHTAAPTDAATAPGAKLRVFAIQFKQDARYVTDYATYAAKMDCLIREYVQPYRLAGGVNLVVFNEDIGLETLAIGSRGAVARALASHPAPGESQLDDQTGVPAGAAAGLGSVGAGYARSLAAYRTLFPDEDPRRAILTAATDTFVRGFMTTFSKLARTYDVYVVAANNQANLTESSDPADIAALSDPDLASEYATGATRSVWKATSADVWNQAFLWGPADTTASGIGTTQLQWLREQLGLCDDRQANPLPCPGGFPSATTPAGAYDPRANLLAVNKKVPLTSIEDQFLALSLGDTQPHNTGPFEIPALGDAYRFGFAISLPAFAYGGKPFGSAPPSDPCGSGDTWMYCLDARGVNVVLQPEANPGPWETGADGIGTQAVSWGASTLRAVRDPAVHFSYLVCPHMVGNLLDLPFDGQSAIMQRASDATPKHYAGAGVALPEDGAYRIYAGEFGEFLALAPWVMPELPQLTDETDQSWERRNRAALTQRSLDLRAGSGSPHENGYLETAIYADLTL